jgi:probable rRNA maturation factor
MAVSILNSQTRPVSTGPLLLAAEAILSIEDSGSCEVSIVLSDDEAVQALNRDHRFIDKPTDVLSFAQRDIVADSPQIPSSANNTGDAEILGDVIISVDTAARQADSQRVAVEDELALLGVHGILHLLGYDDSTEEGADRMRERERAALGTIGLSHPMERN